jgi:ABC-type transport system involved in multi-copper enzyme maturation permease subunit
LLGPIFNREVLTVPRRPQHYLNRAAYLGILWVLAVTAWQATVGWSITPTLYETSRFGPLLFRLCAAVQLVLLLFFSALAAAAAVAQEKDRRTFVLLLLTDLANYEIVLGKLLGSLLQIALFLAAVVPVLLLVTLLGGVAPYQVGQTILILASTALAAGSLGTLVALWRDRTFQALALTVLFIVLYLCMVNALPLIAARVLDPSALPAVEYYQQWVEPLRALDSVHQPRYADEPPLAPASGYAAGMGLFSVLLVGWSMLRLRVWNPSGEPIVQREQPDEETEAAEAALTGVGRPDAQARSANKGDRKSIHAAPGAVREVGDNPILWREIFTRAYGRRPLLVKLAYGVNFGLVCYYALALLSGPGRIPPFVAAYGLVPAAILSLLPIATQSATAITSERDTGALDLLLVTDLTPKEFIFGKLGGILYNTKEYILPPLILIIIYAGAGKLATPPANYGQMRALVNYEAALCMVGAALLLIAFTVVLGVHVSLRTPNSRLAVLNTLSTVFFLSVGTLVCVYLIVINGRFEYQWTSFLVFTVAGVSGLWWVLNGTRPSAALTLASWFCPFAVLYCVINVLVGKPGTAESSDPLMPFFVLAGAFGFTLFAMLVPLLSEFDIALGRTTGANE